MSFLEQIQRVEDRKNERLNRIHNIIQDLYQHDFKTTFAILGDDIRFLFQHNYNPEKGETPLNQLDRWLEFIVTNYQLRYSYNSIEDIWLFDK